MKFSLFLLLSIFVFSASLTGQELNSSKYSKIKINLIGRDLNSLTAAGLETDHGSFVKNRSFTSDFSEAEISLIKELGFQYDVIVEDVTKYYSSKSRESELVGRNFQSKSNCDQVLVNEYPYKTPSQYQNGSMGGYFTYQELKDILDSMASKYPHLITVRKNIEGFKTHDGNDIFYVKVSDNPNAEESEEPKILYTALHHAREPNSLSQMIFYLWYLLENYQSEDDVTKILNETQLYFVPCVNPDGYLYNQATAPIGGGLWRKNKWKNAGGELKGVDLNRNYGVHWGFDDVGSSSDQNSATFRGESAFSEPETQALRKLCLDNNFKIAQNYHSYGNYLIHPWGFNDSPTPEDSLFKAMGNVMNKQNNFLMGTGIETVGYTVNGDSDDYMYGEDVEKTKIYSYTPEVGPSFWPPVVDIDYLNRSCMWLNLSTALLTLNYYTAEEVGGKNYLSNQDNNLTIRATRTGLMSGSAEIKLESVSPGVTVMGESRIISLNHASSVDLEFELSVDNQMDYPDGIGFLLTVNNDGLITEELIVKEWISKDFVSIFKDDLNNTDQFEASDWAITDQTYYSAPSSMTDSKTGDYESNQVSEIKIKTPFDLSNIEKAFLSFYAKWDIESNFDYVQVLASRDNIGFMPLCGKFTKIGSEFQAFNSPVYDGRQRDWVNEEIDLTDFLGSPKVWIKFVLDSDEYLEGDGFYFDDIELKTISKTSSSADLKLDHVKIYPSLIRSISNCEISGINLDGKISIVISNLIGEIVKKQELDSNQFNIDPNLYTNGTYFVEVWKNGVRMAVNKLMILK